MKIGQVLITRHQHAPPDGRADLQQEDVKLIDDSRSFFFCHCLFPFLIPSAWKLLDALFQLVAAGQGVAHGGSNSRRAIFGLMTRIDGNFFQRPASRPSTMSKIVT